MRTHLSKRVVRWLNTVPLALLLVASVAFAIGEQTGRITGRLIDKDTNTTLPGATVVIDSKALIGGPQTKYTADDGTFEFANLPAGDYSVTVSYEGTKPLVRQLTVAIGTATPLEVRWSPEVDSFEETVVVKGSHQMNPDSTQSGRVLNTDTQGKIASQRSYQNVAQQVAGVSGGANPNVRGANALMNRYLIDGLDVTDPVTNTFSSNVNFDAISSIAVLTGGMEAQYNSLGGVINLVTNGGSDDYTADFSVYYNDYRLSASNPSGPGQAEGFRPFLVTKLPPTQSLTANASVGGPIVKQRLWLSLGLQYTTNSSSQPAAPPLNTQALPRVFTAYYPRAKLTFAPDPKNRITISALADPAIIDNTVNGGSGANFVTPTASRRQEQGGAMTIATWDYFISDTVSTKLQLGYQEQYIVSGPQGFLGTIDTSSFVGKYSDYSLEYDYGRPRHFNEDDGTAWYNTTSWSDDRRRTLSPEFTFFWRFKGLGSHELQSGVQTRIARRAGELHVPGGSVYTDRGGGPGEAGLCNEQTGKGCYLREDTPPYSGVESGYSVGTYVQDRWRLNDWLILLPGLRLDYGTSNDADGNLVSRLLGLGPRLGLVFDITRDQKTLFTAWYGRSNEVFSLLAAANASAGATTQVYEWNQATKSFEFAATDGGPGGTQLAPETLTPPHSDAIQVGLRRDLGGALFAGVEYTYKRLSNIWDIQEVNQIWDPTGARVIGYRNGKPGQVFLIATPDENYNVYQSVDVSLQGQPVQNIDVYGAYTLAFKSGPGSDSLGQLGLRNQFYNPRQRNFYTGFAFGDIRHQVKVSGAYTVGGFSVGPNVRYTSGEVIVAQYLSQDRGATFLRSPMGTNPNTPNDLEAIAELRTPPLIEVDVRASYDFQSLIGQKLSIIADVFNALNLSGPTTLETRKRADNLFGSVTARQQPLRFQLALRYLL